MFGRAVAAEEQLGSGRQQTDPGRTSPTVCVLLNLKFSSFDYLHCVINLLKNQQGILGYLIFCSNFVGRDSNSGKSNFQDVLLEVTPGRRRRANNFNTNLMYDAITNCDVNLDYDSFHRQTAGVLQNGQRGHHHQF